VPRAFINSYLCVCFIACFSNLFYSALQNSFGGSLSFSPIFVYMNYLLRHESECRKARFLNVAKIHNHCLHMYHAGSRPFLKMAERRKNLPKLLGDLQFRVFQYPKEYFKNRQIKNSLFMSGNSSKGTRLYGCPMAVT
jgi:hypothetical protein